MLSKDDKKEIKKDELSTSLGEHKIQFYQKMKLMTNFEKKMIEQCSMD
jgi:hypothetical protein